jgi:phosphatidylinositol dimannoside acyltransferase
MRGMLLRVGLNLADLLVRSLPTGAAYALADLAGRAWHAFAPTRRALVAENLARVCAATGRPTSGRPFRQLVERAFVEHARYYLELLRAPHYPDDRIDEIVRAEEWEHWEAVMRGGAIIAFPHFGSFPPFGHLLAAHGLSGVAPVEEVRPRELYDFLAARRAAGRSVEMIPLSRARRRMVETLRAGGVVAIAADRDLKGDGIEVQIFDHPTTLPASPAALAVMTGRPLVLAVCTREAPERFLGRAWSVEAELSGDRRADVAALTRALAARLEEAVAAAPEQWFATFQPYWSDQRAGETQ